MALHTMGAHRASNTLATSTPWGTPDFVNFIAPGVAFYQTPGHGGYLLDAERAAQVPACAKSRSFVHKGPNGSMWFEEDCEWASVALTFPELFPSRALWHALAMVTKLFQVPAPQVQAWLRQPVPTEQELHEADDPHCTCNDCIASFDARLEA